MTNQNSHVEACVDLIRERKRVLIPKLLELLEERGVKTEGRWRFKDPNRPWKHHWTKLSPAARDILEELTDRFGVALVPESWWSYIFSECEPANTNRWTPAAFVVVDPKRQLDDIWGGRRPT